MLSPVAKCSRVSVSNTRKSVVCKAMDKKALCTEKVRLELRISQVRLILAEGKVGEVDAEELWAKLADMKRELAEIDKDPLGEFCCLEPDSDECRKYD